MSQARTDSLALIEAALAATPSGRERAWAVEASRALASVQQALQRRLAAADRPDGPLAEVDRTRPSLDRQARKLSEEVAALLTEADALQDQLRVAAEAFASQPGSPDGRPPLAGGGGVPDFGQLRQQAECWLAALRAVRKVETDLVLESVTTDLGAGD